MNKYIVIAGISAVLLVTLNIKLAMDYGNSKFQAGLVEGCNTGFTHLIKQRYGVTTLPGSLRAEIAAGCVASNATVVQ